MPKYTTDEAKALVQDRVAITDKIWRNKRDLWAEIYSLYRFWTDVEAEVDRGERSNIFIPLAFSIVETKLPRLVQALLGLEPWFKTEGRGRVDMKNARFMSDTMRYQLKDEINAYFRIVMWWKEALIYGNSYMFVGWEKEIAKVKKRIPNLYGNTELVGYDYEDVDEVVYDGISLNHIDLLDCNPAPFGTRINGRMYERMPYFLVRSEPTAEYLKSLAERDILNKKTVKAVFERFPQGSGELDRTRKDRMSYNRMSTTNMYDKHSPRYEMWTMYEHDHWVSLIENEVVRNDSNPYGDNNIPIVEAMDTPVPHEHFAIGQIEPIMKLNYYANDLENMTLDWLFKALNPGSIISQDSFLDPAKFQNNPDGIHIVKGSVDSAHKTIEKPNLNIFAGDKEKINIERLIDKVLGQSDVSRGQSRVGSDTATEIVSLIQQANFRFDLSVKLLKNESLIPMLDLIANRNMLLFPHEKEIKRYLKSGEPEFMNVGVSQLIGNYRFRMVTNPAQGNKIAYAQTLIKYLSVVNDSQGQNPKLVLEIAKYLDIDNVEDLLDNPVMDAVMTIVQAAKEGLLANSRQAAVVLGQVLNVLAPPGSPQAEAAGASLQKKQAGASQAKPAEDNKDIAAQTGQGAAV